MMYRVIKKSNGPRTLYLEEGEDHASAEHEFVDLSEHALDDRDLGGDLRPTYDGGEGTLGHIHGALEILQLLLQQESRHRGLQIRRHAYGTVCY